jgi:cytochrome c oxidase assembly protein subunit 15
VSAGRAVGRLGDRTWLVRLGWATLVANIGIVLTGGAVRLTASGLGCPTWPRCTDESFTPHGALDFHSIIEFGNRTLTFVLAAIAVLTFVSAWQSGRRDLRVLSAWLGLSIPAQALVGGLTVLTGLNPWIVSFHLLFSLAIISLAVLYLHRIDTPAVVAEQRRPGQTRPAPRRLLAWTTYAVTWIVLYLGTVVTGSGPHAGDLDVPRNGLDPLLLSQLHADFVFLLVGLTVALVIVHPSRATWTLLGVELAQGLIGFVQYFTDLPVVLVGFHLLGAALIAAVSTWMVIAVSGSVSGSVSGPVRTRGEVSL